MKCEWEIPGLTKSVLIRRLQHVEMKIAYTGVDAVPGCVGFFRGGNPGPDRIVEC